MVNIIISLINLISLALGGIAIGLTYSLTRRNNLPFLNFYLIFLICAVVAGFCDWIVFNWVQMLVPGISENTTDFIYHIFWDLIGFPAYLFAFYYLFRAMNSLLIIHIRRLHNKILVLFLIAIILLDYTGFYFRLQESTYIFSNPLWWTYTIILPFLILVYLLFTFLKSARSRATGLLETRFILILLIGFLVWTLFSFTTYILGEWKHLIIFTYYLLIFVPALYLFMRQKGFKIRPKSNNEQNLEKVLRDYKLTAREIELAILLMDGKSNQEISDELFVSTQTVKNYISKMYRQTGVKNRIQFVNFFRSRSS